MNRNRPRDNRGLRDRRSGGNFGLGDGLLGEGPPSGGVGPMMGAGPMVGGPMAGNPMGLRDTQLALAQSLIQQQQLVSAGFGVGGGDFSGLGNLAGGMHLLQQQQQQLRPPLGAGLMGAMRNDRKRTGGQMRRDSDEKRGRRDSWGRGERDRSNRSGQDRDRNRSSRWESDKDKKKHGEDYDPAEPTEDDEEGHKSGCGEGSNLYCHVCGISVYDDESFQRHLNGLKHKARMESITSAHSMRSSHMNFRLKAEEHLRNIERKGGRDPDYFCKICNNDLAIPWEKHRYSNIHKQRLLQVRKGCGWCKVHDFTNFTEVLEHRETDEHKKNAEIYGKKEDDKDDGSQQLKETGNDKEGTNDKEEQVEEVEEDLTIPEYDAEVPVGMDYVIPVTGYFCKLCHKFYNKKSARATHCQSTTHYEKFKEATEVKIAAREKKKEEERLRKEKEAEEAAAAAAAAAAAEEEDEAMDATEVVDEEEDAKEDEEANGEAEFGDGDDQQQEVEEEGEKEGMEEEVEEQDEDAILKEEVDEEDEDSLENEQDLSGDMGADESTINATVDTSSFFYIPGEDNIQQELMAEKQEEADDCLPDDSIGDVVASELSQSSLNPEDDDLDLSVPEESAAAVVEAASVVEETPKPVTTRGRGTAKRGRGRGRSKK